MGCGDACPLYPGKRYLDWQLDDPAGKSLDQVRPIRDEINPRVEELLGELVGLPSRLSVGAASRFAGDSGDMLVVVYGVGATMEIGWLKLS